MVARILWEDLVPVRVWVSRLFKFMRNFMDYFFIFGAKYFYLLVLALAFFWFLKQPKDKKKEILIFGLFALPVIYITAKLISLFYYDPRPFIQSHFTPLISHKADNGFPSDHTLISAAVSAVTYPFNKKLSVLLWVITALVGVSRIYVGVHHPIDVLGSMVIAAIAAFVLYKSAKSVIIKSGKKN